MKKKYKILIHLAFWLYMFNQTWLAILLRADKGYGPFEEITIYPITSFITFYALYYCFGFFFKKEQWMVPAIISVSVFCLLIPLRIGLEYIFWKFPGASHIKPNEPLIINSLWWFNSLRMVIIFAIYALLIRLAIGWFESQKMKAELMLQNQSSELALLRSQVNPHFLFNTLNNIYSLVYKKSDDAPAAIMKMSSIMRYVLYDANTDKVLLEKEVEYLQSFIELQKLRILKKDFILVDVHGNMEGLTIAPMLLIPFVENAFKHGSKNVPSPGIKIRLFVEKGQVTFEVSNYFRKGISVKDNTSGIGLSNIRRRLDLLYSGRYSLDIKQDQDIFYIKLILYQ
jgi:two-component system, LytTR family, sensor kinase